MQKDCLNVFDGFFQPPGTPGTLWSLLGPFGIPWETLEPFEAPWASWNFVEPFGTPWGPGAFFSNLSKTFKLAGGEYHRACWMDDNSIAYKCNCDKKRCSQKHKVQKETSKSFLSLLQQEISPRVPLWAPPGGIPKVCGLTRFNKCLGPNPGQQKIHQTQVGWVSWLGVLAGLDLPGDTPQGTLLGSPPLGTLGGIPMGVPTQPAHPAI